MCFVICCWRWSCFKVWCPLSLEVQCVLPVSDVYFRKKKKSKQITLLHHTKAVHRMPGLFSQHQIIGGLIHILHSLSLLVHVNHKEYATQASIQDNFFFKLAAVRRISSNLADLSAATWQLQGAGCKPTLTEGNVIES